MSDSVTAQEDFSVSSSYIALSDFIVDFKPEVSDFFSSRLGKDEFKQVCSLACQAPPYTSIRIDLLKVTRKEALYMVSNLIEPFNRLLVEENREPVQPYLHEFIQELIIIPSAKSVCPDIEHLRHLPLVVIDRLCAESVLRGSDIYVKGIRSMSKSCVKGTRVCLAVDLHNGELPRGSDLSHFTGHNLIIGEGVLQLSRAEVFSMDSGLCIDHIHRLSFDLPPLQQLPDALLMQNFPSLITSRIVSPLPEETILDCCAAPGNKWSHLAMIMEDKGLVMGMDRSLKKAVDNLLVIKQKFGYQSLQIRYQDMTKGVLSEEEEKRLVDQDSSYTLMRPEIMISPLQSKSFQKKLVRIQKQKERKQRDKQLKRGADAISPDVIPSIDISNCTNQNNKI